MVWKFDGKNVTMRFKIYGRFRTVGQQELGIKTLELRYSTRKGTLYFGSTRSSQFRLVLRGQEIKNRAPSLFTTFER
jgi:hypothetical protein